VFRKGLGLANVETGQAVTPEMLFRLGSTTKMFTAAALAMLAEEGKLKLDEPIGKCISGLNPAIAALTAHQLLTHSAGLTDESIMSGRHDDAALADGIRKMDSSWLFTAPGKIHSYSNPGYWIAGLACEQIVDKPYADVMEERLFRPLGMKRTTLRPTWAMTWPLALGHEVKNGKPSIVRPQADNAATWPAGQMYSNVEELSRFVIAFMHDGRLDGQQVLSPAVISKLAAPHVPRHGTNDHYGYGLSVSTERGVRIVQHGGSRTGYGSTIRMAPDKHIAVIVLTNRSGSSLPKTTTRAMELALSLSPEPAKPNPDPQSLSATEIFELVGTYTNNRQTVELYQEDGKLRARRRGDGFSRLAGEVTRTGEHRLSVAAPGTEDESGRPIASFTVVSGADGKPEYLMSGSRALQKQSAQKSN
jgi:CubicO group peptidase (beta-lactamase class C family)